MSRSSRKCARCAPCTFSTESIDSSHSLVSSGSRSSNGEASGMSGGLLDEAADDRGLKFSGQGTSCGGIASRRARHSRRPAESEARCAHAAKARRGHRRLLAGTRRGGTRDAPRRGRPEEAAGRLPSAPLWQRLYRDSRSQGQVGLLSARITPEAIPVVVAFAKNTASAFERLLLGARAWKELKPPARARVLIATQGLDEEAGTAARPAA